MSEMKTGTYDNQYTSTNLYGRALRLLSNAELKSPSNAIHLDIGCGYGHIAEPLVAALGRPYVGLDADPAALASLRQRGFEAHQVNLGDRKATLDALLSAVGNRSVASISFLDCLEHLSNGNAVIQGIGDFARIHSAMLVISTPNVAHRDIIGKLLLGRFEYTDAGLLDHTHLRLFDEQHFVNTLKQGGIYPIEFDNIVQPKSDQHFPVGHPALEPTATLAKLVAQLSERANNHSTTNQFLCLCASGQPSSTSTYTIQRSVQRPFLSIVIRTQGMRLSQLTETLLCLAGQSNQDFEVLIMGHKLSTELQLGVEQVIEDQDEQFRKKITLHLVEEGGRTRPLNAGFELSRGHYIVSLDDDDLVFSNWIETFHSLASANPGQAVRSVCVRQDAKITTISKQESCYASGPFESIYPSSHSFLDQLRDNNSPIHSIAIPREAYFSTGIRFDESLTTAEDWDFFQQVFNYTGVASSSEITCIYRWWQANNATSRDLHSAEEWQANRLRILAKQDARVTLLPPGSTKEIRALLDIVDEHKKFQAALTPGNSTASTAAVPWRKSAIVTMKKSLRRDIALCRIKRALFIFSPKRRAKYASRIRSFELFLQQM